MTLLIALAGLATYVAQTPLQHDGTDYPVGSPVQLGPEAAQPLLDVRAIAHADDNAAQALQAAGGGVNGVDELLADLQRRDEQLSEARGQVEGLQARVAELSQALQEQATNHVAELNDLQEQRDALTAQRDEASLASAELRAKLDQAEAETTDLRQQLTKAQAGATAAKGKTK